MSGSLVIAPEWLGRSGLWQIDAKGKRRAVDAEDIDLSEALGRPAGGLDGRVRRDL